MQTGKAARLLIGVGLVMACPTTLLQAATLEVANYNIEADTNGNTAPNSGLDAVIEAIGLQTYAGIQQRVDILGLEETTSNTLTVSPIVSSLNSFYGAGSYAMASYQGTEVGNDPSTGNGPNALIYNAKTVTLINAVGVANTPNSSGGAYRQVIRYQFQPVGGTSANTFYVYVSHMKSSASGSTSSVQSARNTEATEIRADEATLPANASVIYMGDFNMSGSFEPAYQTLTGTGQGQAVDPLNTANDYAQTWGTANPGILTESDTALRYRDDIQFMSSNVYNHTSASGLQYVLNSYRAFGNNGTTAYGDDVDQTSNTALNNVTGTTAYRNSILADLDTASDHLPIVSDYTISVVPEPGADLLLGCGIFVLGVWSWRLRASSKKDKRLF